MLNGENIDDVKIKQLAELVLTSTNLTASVM